MLKPYLVDLKKNFNAEVFLPKFNITDLDEEKVRAATLAGCYFEVWQLIFWDLINNYMLSSILCEVCSGIMILNILMNNVPKWSDTVSDSGQTVCLTILGRYTVKG